MRLVNTAFSATQEKTVSICLFCLLPCLKDRDIACDVLTV